MGKKATLSIKEDIVDLKKLKAKQKSVKGEKQILALIHIKSGKFETRVELADSLGVHIRTLERWIKQYTQDGLGEMVTDKPRPKPSKIITKEIHDGIEKRVKSPNDPFLGYWEAKQWVLEEYGVEVKYNSLRMYMIKKFGTKVKRPRKAHVKKVKGAEEAFLKTTVYAEQG